MGGPDRRRTLVRVIAALIALRATMNLLVHAMVALGVPGLALSLTAAGRRDA
jgi:hypothetical protein